MSKKELWDERVGPWGARVRVKETRMGGEVVLLFSNRNGGSGYDREPLGFAVREPDGELNPEALELALDEARNLSFLLQKGNLPEKEPEPVTFGELFDLFREEELPLKSPTWREDLRRGLEGLERILGRDLLVRDFSRHDWERFIRLRTSGAIDARGRPVPENKRQEVSPSTAAYDLKILQQVCAWGAEFPPENRPLPDGRRFLLAEDPSRSRRLKMPKEKNPKRPTCSDERFKKLIEVAPRLRVGRGKDKERSPLYELLILSRGTGARIGAIVALKWGDWSAEPSKSAPFGVLRFQAEHDKEGKERRTPVMKTVRDALEGLYAQRLATHGIPGEETWIFPASESEGHIRPDVAWEWLLKAEELAGLDHPPGFGFHAMRRAWASKRRGLPVHDVAAAGGWDTPEVLQTSYQQADDETIKRVVLHEETLPGLE